jgi:2-octaprenylphenol hydroxylase
VAERCEIAVVGGGVVGAATTLALNQAGFDVRLLERSATPPTPGEDYDPRVYAISPASARWLRELGVWQAMPANRLGTYESMRIWESSPEKALSLDAADIGGAALGWIVEQSQLLSAIWAALPAGVAEPRCDVTAADIDADGATLRLADGRSLQAELVIAAEGALSPLRERAGIATAERQYEQHALVTHLRCERAHGGVALQRFLPGGPLAFLPLADGRRSIVWSLPPDEAEALCAQPAEAFHQALSAAIQFEVGVIGESSPRFTFPLRLLHAQQYVKDRLVLIGDSAHVVHPLAGQGVNLGLGDASALVSELGAARGAGNDWTSARLLRRYERSRKADNLEMLALTDALDRAFRGGSAGLSKVLDLGLSLLDRVDPIKRLLIRRAIS